MKRIDNSTIKSLFEPQSFAVIGASQNPKKIGHTITRNIIEGGFKGSVYPVNPEGGELLGKKVYKSILDIKENVDVASIAVPAKFVVDIVKDCAARGVKHVQIITSGFSEVGNIHQEREIVSTASPRG
jgi:acyl-CoA synthetase (NDP forming)